jgi:hypothetical protein
MLVVADRLRDGRVPADGAFTRTAARKLLLIR